ncbi:hypothetical protein DFJ73DRAFT_212345 [Zopfochytrium polystomum]|nr:hypothetical protein DFJ73DRAFT_212345 [Zopfochytrium polystomum]
MSSRNGRALSPDRTRHPPQPAPAAADPRPTALPLKPPLKLVSPQRRPAASRLPIAVAWTPGGADGGNSRSAQPAAANATSTTDRQDPAEEKHALGHRWFAGAEQSDAGEKVLDELTELTAELSEIGLGMLDDEANENKDAIVPQQQQREWGGGGLAPSWIDSSILEDGTDAPGGNLLPVEDTRHLGDGVGPSDWADASFGEVEFTSHDFGVGSGLSDFQVQQFCVASAAEAGQADARTSPNPRETTAAEDPSRQDPAIHQKLPTRSQSQEISTQTHSPYHERWSSRPLDECEDDIKSTGALSDVHVHHYFHILTSPGGESSSRSSSFSTQQYDRRSGTDYEFDRVDMRRRESLTSLPPSSPKSISISPVKRFSAGNLHIDVAVEARLLPPLGPSSASAIVTARGLSSSRSTVLAIDDVERNKAASDAKKRPHEPATTTADEFETPIRSDFRLGNSSTASSDSAANKNGVHDGESPRFYISADDSGDFIMTGLDEADLYSDTTNDGEETVPRPAYIEESQPATRPRAPSACRLTANSTPERTSHFFEPRIDHRRIHSDPGNGFEPPRIVRPVEPSESSENMDAAFTPASAAATLIGSSSSRMSAVASALPNTSRAAARGGIGPTVPPRPTSSLASRTDRAASAATGTGTATSLSPRSPPHEPGAASALNRLEIETELMALRRRDTEMHGRMIKLRQTVAEMWRMAGPKPGLAVEFEG